MPKKEDASGIGDFRLISLLNGVYKIVAKCLAVRLKPLMGFLIGNFQSALVLGWQILDGFLVAHECIESRMRQNLLGLVWKLDMENVYDSVCWTCLDEVMRCMGFGQKWRDWIGYCVSSVKFSVLVNGSLKGFFDCGHGLRQGDPLSLLLFSLVPEVFGHMCVKRDAAGMIRFLS